VKAEIVILGVPRIKELIDAAKNMKTPGKRLGMKPEYEDKAEEPSAALAYVGVLRAGDVVEALSFVREPKLFESAVSELDDELTARERQNARTCRDMQEGGPHRARR
jgi:hypothetical protein